jgi:hypothetical protein
MRPKPKISENQVKNDAIANDDFLDIKSSVKKRIPSNNVDSLAQSLHMPDELDLKKPNSPIVNPPTVHVKSSIHSNTNGNIVVKNGGAISFDLSNQNSSSLEGVDKNAEEAKNNANKQPYKKSLFAKKDKSGELFEPKKDNTAAAEDLKIDEP